MFLGWVSVSCLLTVVNLMFLGWVTLSCLLTVVNLMFFFRTGNIKSATVSSQLNVLKNCQIQENTSSQLTLFNLQLFSHLCTHLKL